MIKWIKDLNRLVRWVRTDFGKNKAVFIYNDGRRSIVDLEGPPTRFITIPRAGGSVWINDALPSCERPTVRRFKVITQEHFDVFYITVYEEIEECDTFTSHGSTHTATRINGL